MTALLLALALPCGCRDGGPKSADSMTTAADSAGAEDSGAAGELELGPARPCEAPAAQVSYREVGAEWGFARSTEPDGEFTDGGAFAIDDLDGDGDLDWLIGFPNAPAVLYEQEGGVYTPHPLEEASKVITFNLADVDGDGWRDLLLGRHGAPRLLLVREGGALQWGELPEWELDGNVKELAPADLDGDGDMDLYAVVRGGGDDLTQKEDAVLWNRGGGAFELDREAVPESARYNHGFDAAWFDADGDGDQDLYVANDLGSRYGGNSLLENRGGELVDRSDDCACALVQTAMSAAAADFSGDGLPDLYTTDATDNHLLQGLSDGTWVDVSRALGADLTDGPVHMSWGAIFYDRENDGDLDLLVGRGDYTSGEPSELSTPAALDWNGVSFEQVGAALGFDEVPGVYRAVAALDLNGDGLLDPVISRVYEPPMVFLSQGCTAAGWLEVEGPEGSRVEVEVGGELRVAWITAQSGLAVAVRPLAHLGLGEAQSIDRLRVLTPDGGERVLEGPIDARRVVYVP
jgi:hypothetical protein